LFFGYAGIIAGAVLSREMAWAADPQPAPVKSRICKVDTGPVSTDSDRPATIVASNEGGWCPHIRKVGMAVRYGGQGNRVYDIAQPPQHGTLAQDNQNTQMVVSYKPTRGYTGTDSFVLRTTNNVKLAYSVSVVP